MRTLDRASTATCAGRAMAAAALLLLCACQGQQPPGKPSREPAAIRALRQFVNSQSQAAQIAGAQAKADQKLEETQRAAAAISAANRDTINQRLGQRAQAEQQAAAAAAKPRTPEPGAAPPPVTGDLSEYTFPTTKKP